MQNQKHNLALLHDFVSSMQTCSLFGEFPPPSQLNSIAVALPWKLIAQFRFPCKLTSSIYRIAKEEPFGFKLMKKGREASLRDSSFILEKLQHA